MKWVNYDQDQFFKVQRQVHNNLKEKQKPQYIALTKKFLNCAFLVCNGLEQFS